MFPIFIPTGGGGFDLPKKVRVLVGIAILGVAVGLGLLLTGAIIDEPYRRKGIYDNPGNTLASTGAGILVGESIIGIVALGIAFIRMKDIE